MAILAGAEVDESAVSIRSGQTLHLGAALSALDLREIDGRLFSGVVSADAVRIESGGGLVVSGGGVASSVIISAGASATVGFGGAVPAIMADGGLLVSGGGVAARVTIAAGGSAAVESGGALSVVTVRSGGALTMAQGDTIDGLTIASGASAGIAGMMSDVSIAAGARVGTSGSTVGSGKTLRLSGTVSAFSARLISGGLFSDVSDALSTIVNSGRR